MKRGTINPSRVAEQSDAFDRKDKQAATAGFDVRFSRRLRFWKDR
jgi:hypothetical protein